MLHRTVVIKIGTSVLTAGTDRVSTEQISKLCASIAKWRQKHHQVVICCSGAIAAGREVLGFPELENTILEKQMLASVGQPALMAHWREQFDRHHLSVGQLLLTQADLMDKSRFINARDALTTMLRHGVIPIINENDAVAVEEIKVGDNDNLSARVAMLADADELIMLTDQAGLFDSDPRGNADAKLIREVTAITSDIEALAGGSGTNLGTGGMSTKISAAKIAMRSGIQVTVCSGFDEDNLDKLLANPASVGTQFVPAGSALGQKKQWMLGGAKPSGTLAIDDGAVLAIKQSGKSLLAKGVVSVHGGFERGDLVTLYNGSGELIAKGLVRYSSSEIEQLKGLHSSEFQHRLGYSNGGVLMHRNDMVTL